MTAKEVGRKLHLEDSNASFPEPYPSQKALFLSFRIKKIFLLIPWECKVLTDASCPRETMGMEVPTWLSALRAKSLFNPSMLI